MEKFINYDRTTTTIKPETLTVKISDLSHFKFALSDEDIEAYIDGVFTTIQATYKIVEDENILYTDTLKIPVEYLLKEKNDQSLQILFLINNFVPKVIRESNECPIFSECANNIIIKFSKPYGFLKKELFDYIKNEL